MDPFFRTHFNQPSRHYPARGASTAQPAVARKPTAVPSPKVISIPVQFVGSEPDRAEIAHSVALRPASALKIQKVFRGFRVRKSVKKIVSIKNDVDSIEVRVSKPETVALIQKDPKERVRVNETLMGLLFKLDSVRGVDSGVRDFRKGVIKKAIALQERVDDIATAPVQTVVEQDGMVDLAADEMDGPDQTPVAKDDDSDKTDGLDQTLAVKVKNCAEEEIEDVDENMEVDGPDQTQVVKVKDSNGVAALDDQTLDVKQIECEKAVVEMDGPDQALDAKDSAAERMEGVEDNLEMDCPDVPVADMGDGSDSEFVQVDMPEVKSDEEPCVVKEVVGTVSPLSQCIENNAGKEVSNAVKNEMEVESVAMPEGGAKECRDDNKRSREMLEKMVEENGKMMNLMTQLFERNEVQTRMLGSLTRRVEQLEKALVCDKLRRKKKRNGFE
ncbi:hypothetical protein RJ639_032980 [Escallonia herrerae]|uniref:BAG domain-containing protein n=1 Tax=Escallonia herrerae TaxID=1293975 RepID=A0AA88X2Q5_9ASTE|nr:hypothetical protein RJ639_032980 [Escallonia herrerae]